MKETLLTVEGLCGGYGAHFALKDISFAIKKGTLTGLLGANGSGKTTLLKMLCQQMKHEGTCVLSQKEADAQEGLILEQLSSRRLARLVSYIPQRTGITVSMAVLDVVLMGFQPVLGLLERPGRAQRQQAQQALEMLGLGAYVQRDFLSLSEGQKALVLLARTLVEDSRLLILDEPDSALDLPNRYGFLSRIAGLIKERESGGILSLHDPQLALHFCHQLILMKEGRLVGRICPEVDPLPEMEAALGQIYGPVTLVECAGRDKRRRLALLWEQQKDLTPDRGQEEER